jgi:hypothetical protein
MEGAVAKRGCSFKDIQNFKQIAEILGMSFEDVKDLVYSMRKNSIDENYAEMVSEMSDDND